MFHSDIFITFIDKVRSANSIWYDYIKLFHLLVTVTRLYIDGKCWKTCFYITEIMYRYCSIGHLWSSGRTCVNISSAHWKSRGSYRSVVSEHIRKAQCRLVITKGLLHRVLYTRTFFRTRRGCASVKVSYWRQDIRHKTGSPPMIEALRRIDLTSAKCVSAAVSTKFDVQIM